VYYVAGIFAQSDECYTQMITGITRNVKAVLHHKSAP